MVEVVAASVVDVEGTVVDAVGLEAAPAAVLLPSAISVGVLGAFSFCAVGIRIVTELVGTMSIM